MEDCKVCRGKFNAPDLITYDEGIKLCIECQAISEKLSVMIKA